jgi:hypothetical protein
MKFSMAKGDVDVVGRIKVRKGQWKKLPVEGGYHHMLVDVVPIKRATWVDRPGRGYAARQAAKREKE